MRTQILLETKTYARDVNLAALLMNNYESVQAACSLHTSSGLEINLPGKKDARLHKSLSHCTK
jgi:hypothetical protein